MRRVVDYMNPYYPQKEIDAKLEQLYNCIDPKLPKEQIEGIKGLLNEMTKYGVSRRTLMEAPTDIKITVDDEYLQTRGWGGCVY